jgi:hypothetical protein
VTSDEIEIITKTVLTSGLTNGRLEDVLFYVNAYQSGNFDWRRVRSFGTLFTSLEKKSAGISYRGKITREFLETLNTAGMLDPVEAGNEICSAAIHRIASMRDIARAKDAGIGRLRFRASKMAAGPCDRAAALDDQKIPISEAEPLPFLDCRNAGQCGCLYQSWIPLMDEIGP